MNRWRELTAALVLVVASCGVKQDAVRVFDVVATGVTWCQDVQDVFAANCTRCHASTLEGAARHEAPITVNFDTYDAAVANAELGLRLMQAGAMPFNGPKVPTDQQALVSAWLDLGMPECDTAGE